MSSSQLLTGGRSLNRCESTSVSIAFPSTIDTDAVYRKDGARPGCILHFVYQSHCTRDICMLMISVMSCFTDWSMIPSDQVST
jgi:hypothetical protein